MKIRNGFVSNSSSSSFIIGLAAITQEQLDTMPKYSYFEVYPIDPSLWKEGGWSLKFTGNKTMPEDGMYANPPSHAEIEAFDWTTVDVDLTGKTYLVELRAYDDVPYDYDSGEEYEYDSVDLDWFHPEAQNAYHWIHHVGGNATYGAGFNG